MFIYIKYNIFWGWYSLNQMLYKINRGQYFGGHFGEFNFIQFNLNDIFILVLFDHYSKYEAQYTILRLFRNDDSFYI